MGEGCCCLSSCKDNELCDYSLNHKDPNLFDRSQVSLYMCVKGIFILHGDNEPRYRIEKKLRITLYSVVPRRTCQHMVCNLPSGMGALVCGADDWVLDQLWNWLKMAHFHDRLGIYVSNLTLRYRRNSSGLPLHMGTMQPR